MFRRLLSAPLAALAVWLPVPAVAGTVTVTVTGANGRPAPDTVVMLRRAASFQTFERRAPAVIVQKDIRFSPYVTVVPQRGSVRFTNEDRYAHHVRTTPGGPAGTVPPATDFEFRLPAARGGTPTSAEVTLENPGAITLGCHLHSAMRAHVYVSSTPYFGVTDAGGRVAIDVPDGPAELLLWHPDELAAQPARAFTVSGATAQAAALNFEPRRRAGAAPRDETRY